jgi:hypothetical protein
MHYYSLRQNNHGRRPRQRYVGEDPYRGNSPWTVRIYAANRNDIDRGPLSDVPQLSMRSASHEIRVLWKGANHRDIKHLGGFRRQIRHIKHTGRCEI